MNYWEKFNDSLRIEEAMMVPKSRHWHDFARGETCFYEKWWTLENKYKQLMILFRNLVMRTKMKTELIADCHGGTEVNLVTALELNKTFGSLDSLLNLEQKFRVIKTFKI